MGEVWHEQTIKSVSGAPCCCFCSCKCCWCCDRSVCVQCSINWERKSSSSWSSSSVSVVGSVASWLLCLGSVCVLCPVAASSGIIGVPAMAVSLGGCLCLFFRVVVFHGIHCLVVLRCGETSNVIHDVVVSAAFVFRLLRLCRDRWAPVRYEGGSSSSRRGVLAIIPA